MHFYVALHIVCVLRAHKNDVFPQLFFGRKNILNIFMPRECMLSIHFFFRWKICVLLTVSHKKAINSCFSFEHRNISKYESFFLSQKLSKRKKRNVSRGTLSFLGNFIKHSCSPKKEMTTILSHELEWYVVYQLQSYSISKL